MHNETFYLDGVDAKTVGITLQSPITFSSPEPIVKIEQIEGRNGALIFETGAYKNRTGRAKCFALRDDVRMSLLEINKFLLSDHGYRRLETSDDPDHFWMARIANGADINKRARILAPFEINFDCKPQMFLREGQYPVEIESHGGGYIYNNYFYPSKPLIIVHGSSAGFLNVSGQNITIKNAIEETYYIDCESQNAYSGRGNVNQNSNIETDSFPVLDSGKNNIFFSGGSCGKIEIIPRWWEL